ncbi:hypothetical protein [Gimesia sp.]|uniref:hypothetical protein n=1 Tax=Gimesia sp. TaxID=2024833 RepID=UPI0025C66833|nr:hypothetical protein [Gimesia sp.]|tara:strand:- start:609 stop:908 length:300 start_codon:yes stop_codon:yes gene_type:complete
MKAVFIESTEFTEWVSEFLPDEVYAQLQQELMDNPQKGTLIPGCGGLRKIRSADPKRGKGKRGGARVIYLYVADAKFFFCSISMIKMKKLIYPHLKSLN